MRLMLSRSKRHYIFFTWAEKCQFLSLDKCCVLYLRLVEPAVSFSLDGVNLRCVSSCRDLAVTVTSDLSPSVHIHDIVAKAHQRSNAIHRCFLSRNVSLLTGAFLVYVRPLVEYNSIVWSPHDINSVESIQRRFTKRLPGFGKYTYSKPLELLNLPSLELRRLHFDLVGTYKIIFGHVDMRSGDFLSWGPPQQLGAILISGLNANVSVASGPLSLRHGLLIFGIVCLVTLLDFLHSLPLSAQLNVSTSVISSTLHSFLRTGNVSLTFVLFMFLFYFFF